ncbi:MAG: class B sortase [Oscillospiraceae bacterium]|nr:class B sortase [Oscillospiraceae bacterium]
MKKGKKILFYIVLVILIGVFAYAAYHLGSYFWEKHKSDQMLNEANKFVTTDPDNGQQGSGNTPTGDPERITVDFAALSELNDDIVAWIYCANTKINYPVVQSYDNDYYLYRLLDGTWNSNGSIFMDCDNSADFSDKNTMIHGHHMQTGAMFASLVKYNSQAYYDEHPYIYIMTPTQTYRMDIFAACVVDSTYDIYSTYPSESIIYECISKTAFDSDTEYSGGNIVTLSTCTYDYDDARFVVLGNIVPVA